MSLTTIELLREQRKRQVELNPSAETFIIVGGSTTFKGTFDEAHVEDNRDKGNITQKKLTPFIMVSERPEGLTERVTKVQREDGSEYTYNKIGKDDEGIPVLWLY